MENIQSLIRSILREEIAAALSGDIANEPTANNQTVRAVRRAALDRSIERSIEPTAVRPERKPRDARPASGYWPTDATMGKRRGSAFPSGLMPNVERTLEAVLTNPGASNRQIADMLVAGGHNPQSAKKAVESALYWLRTHDAAGQLAMVRNPHTGVNEPIRGRKPLVVSKPLVG